jgi:hypothetical protein
MSVDSDWAMVLQPQQGHVAHLREYLSSEEQAGFIHYDLRRTHSEVSEMPNKGMNLASAPFQDGGALANYAQR